jgi:hypothetical protein
MACHYSLVVVAVVALTPTLVPEVQAAAAPELSILAQQVV